MNPRFSQMISRLQLACGYMSVLEIGRGKRSTSKVEQHQAGRRMSFPKSRYPGSLSCISLNRHIRRHRDTVAELFRTMDEATNNNSARVALNLTIIGNVEHQVLATMEFDAMCIVPIENSVFMGIPRLSGIKG